MIDILMYIANGLIISGYILYVLFVLINRNKKITDSNGFDITKEVLNEYDSINIIESTSYFTLYNIKRKIIKIASKCYYGNTVSDIAIPLVEAGISVNDNNKNKFINMFRKIIPNLKLLYILPALAMFLNVNSYGTTDAKIGIILLTILGIISYMLINIKIAGYNFLLTKIANLKDLNKLSKEKILCFINKVILIDKVILLGEMVMIIRFVAMLLKFN